MGEGHVAGDVLLCVCDVISVMMSEVQVSLAGLVEVHGVGLWGAQQVEAPQGVAGQRRGGLCSAASPLPQEASAGGAVGVGGAVLEDGCLWPAGGDRNRE